VFLALAGHGYLAAGLAALVVGTAITFALAIGFERFIDRPAIALAARIARGRQARSA
jgi:peptidoglycan/LPS O-acetylase OafA/YrhL